MNAAVKRLDVICIGRVAVDLYAQQIGSRLEDVASFAKYLGGSSGNVAFGTAIQGLKSAMLARTQRPFPARNAQPRRGGYRVSDYRQISPDRAGDAGD